MAKVLQGSRYNWVDSQFRMDAVSAYFGILGTGDLELAGDDAFTDDSEKVHSCLAIVDFAGTVSSLRARTIANNRPDKYIVAVERAPAHLFEAGDAHYSQIITSPDQLPIQFVIMPPEWDGVMTSQADAEAFLVNDYLVGHVVAVATDAFYNLGLYQGTVVMETDGTRFQMVYRNNVGGGVSYRPTTYEYTAAMLGGSLGHYATTQMTDDPDSILTPYPSPEWPPTSTLMRVKTGGTFSYPNLSHDGDEILSIMEFAKGSGAGWDEETGLHVPILPFLGYTLVSLLNTRDSLDVIAEEDVAFWTLGPSDARLWRNSICWKGASSSDGYDWMMGEDWEDSAWGDGRPNGDFLSPDWVYLPGDSPIKRWFINPFGSFGTVQKGVPAVDNNPFVRHEMEISLPVGMRVKNLRGYMDRNYDHRGVKFGVIIDGVDGQSACTLGVDDLSATEEGLFQDNVNFDDIPANTPFCFYIEAIGDFDHVRAHISNLQFTMGPSEATRECLHRVLPAAVAVTKLPCLIRTARCVKIVRPDGQVFAYTEHDRDIEYLGTTYRSCGGFQSSASELGAVLGEVGNMEVKGFAKALGIKIDDLFGGLFDGAVTEVWSLPWGEDNTQPARRIGGGYFGGLKQIGKEYTLESVSPSAYLKQRALLEAYTPTCRFELGSVRCGIHLDSMRVSGSVTSLTTEPSPNGATVRRRFFDDSRVEEDNFFTEGIITFDGGANAGQSSKIKVFAGGQIVLWEPLVYVIAIGDTYTMTPGCDKLKATCIDKFNNLINFGGFDTIPGLDATALTPSGRSGA